GWSWIGHQPAEPFDAACEACRLLGRLHAGAAEARVALDQHVDVDAVERGGPLARVDGDGDAYPLPERLEPLDLPRADERKADQDVVEACVREDLRLAELLACDAARARGDLHTRDLRELVRLDVRTKRD